ncbi:MAG: peptide-methionine (S)-S-oxide reductase MsrA [Acidimicrobiia bacterium]|nr:peptide-methionine (S)-S-oxide reductase MsrA [Acidimicrobiia bacterium]
MANFYAENGPPPPGFEEALFGMGCFWGAERVFWEAEGVWSTAAGYAGGRTAHPTYDAVCSGRTGHAEVVRVVSDPARVSYAELVRLFWEGHDPTQGMRQGNDVGSQYRSLLGVYSDAQADIAVSSRRTYGEALDRAGYPEITTEIARDLVFYPAEDHHQQYLAKNPFGYCGHGGTGVAYPTGLTRAD